MSAVGLAAGDAGTTRPHVRPVDRIGRWAWTAAAVVAALVVVVPIGMLAVSILTPDAAFWRQQWATRLPQEIVSTIVLVVGVGTLSVVLGVGLAWLVSAHRFPGRRVLGWALVLPLAVPGYILGFVTTSVFGVAGPVQGWWRDRFGADAWFPEVRSMPGAIVDALAHAVPVRVPARPGRAARPGWRGLRRGPLARRLAGRGRPAGRGTDAPSRRRRRRRRGRDGDAHGLRHRPVLQRRHGLGRRVPCLAGDLRP